jgi:hypothetical protein
MFCAQRKNADTQILGIVHDLLINVGCLDPTASSPIDDSRRLKYSSTPESTNAV